MRGERELSFTPNSLSSAFLRLRFFSRTNGTHQNEFLKKIYVLHGPLQSKFLHACSQSVSQITGTFENHAV